MTTHGPADLLVRREGSASTIDLRDSSALDDPDRLAELRATELLDSAPEEPFDRITRLAERLLDVPVAMITLVDKDRQFFKSHVGLTGGEAARHSALTHSLCQYVVTSRAALAIADTRGHPLVSANPLVQDGSVGAYAGEPLETSKGNVLGALCVISREQRAWHADELHLLSELSALAMTEIEYRLRTRALRDLEALAEALEEPLVHLGEAVSSLVAVADRADDPLVGRLATAASTRLGRVEAAADDLADSLRWGPVDGTSMIVGLGRRVERAVQIACHSVIDRDITLDIDSGSMLVECDPHVLDRAMSNVLVSLMQYADADRPVDVRLGREERVARLLVRCDGSAVPVSELARMVSRLSDAVPRPAGDTSAAGASLRITGRVTRAMNGPVEGATGPHGTTLSVSFLVARPEVLAVSAPAVSDAWGAVPRKAVGEGQGEMVL